MPVVETSTKTASPAAGEAGGKMSVILPTKVGVESFVIGKATAAAPAVVAAVPKVPGESPNDPATSVGGLVSMVNWTLKSLPGKASTPEGSAAAPLLVAPSRATPRLSRMIAEPVPFSVS